MKYSYISLSVIVVVFVLITAPGYSDAECRTKLGCSDPSYMRKLTFIPETCQRCFCLREYLFQKICVDINSTRPGYENKEIEGIDPEEFECPDGTYETDTDEHYEFMTFYYQERIVEDCCDTFTPKPKEICPLCTAKWVPDKCRYDLMRIDDRSKPCPFALIKDIK